MTNRADTSQHEPVVSVIVPVYNALPYLRESVDSLLAQSLSDIEVLLIDDGSTDGSPAVCDEYARTDARVRVIHKANSGAGLSRNVGLEQARGEYVTFLDADDLLHPEALARMVKEARDNNLDIVKGARCIFTTGNLPHGEAYGTPLTVYSDPAVLRRIALCYIGQPRGDVDRALRFEGGVWGTLFRRELIEEHGLRFVSEREYGSEDFIFNFETTRVARRVGVTHDTFVHYRMTPGSISRSIKSDTIERLAGYATKLENRISEAGYSAADARIAAMCYFLEIARGQMKFALLGPDPYKKKIAWCQEQCKLPYVQAIMREYPVGTLTAPHRLHLWLMRHRFMHLLYLLTRFHN